MRAFFKRCLSVVLRTPRPACIWQKRGVCHSGISIAMSSRVPVEVAEHIVDQLANDRDTLLACALTPPAWLTRSRVHLFHTVRISTLAQYTPFIAACCSTAPLVIKAVVAYRVVRRSEALILDDVQPGAIENAAVVLLPHAHLPNLQTWAYESVGHHHTLLNDKHRALLACHRHSNGPFRNYGYLTWPSGPSQTLRDFS